MTPGGTGPIHERFFSEGRLTKTKRRALARCSSAIRVWKSVVVT